MTLAVAHRKGRHSRVGATLAVAQRKAKLALCCYNLRFLAKIPEAFHKLSFKCRSSEGRIGKMCLAIPARILRIKGNLAQVNLAGVNREADIRMVSNVRVGEYVLIHAGFAIEKIGKKEAEKTLQLLKEMA